MSLAVSYTTHTVEITASGLAVAAIGNSVEVSAYNHVVQVSPLVYQVSVAQAGVPGPTGPGVPLGGTTGQVMVKLSDADLDTGWGSVGVGDMMKSTYDTDGDGKVNAAVSADAVPWSGVTGKPSAYTPSAHKTSHATGGTDALSPADIGAATAGHDHSGVYSPLGHDHSGVYAPAVHNHDLAYSPLGHDHSGVYSPVGHNHTGVYAPASHSHAISDVTNLQTTLDGKAATTHNHDTAYSPLGHDHSGVYAPASHTHSEYSLTTHDHSGTYAPASHTHSEYSLTTHDHSGVYSPVGHDHSGVYAPASHSHAISDVTNLQTALDGKASTTHNHDSAYAAASHNHDTVYLSKTNTTEYTPTANYHPTTKKYVDDLVSSSGGGDMLKSVYDLDNDGKVDAAEAADSVPWSGVTDKPSTYTPSAHKTSHATGGTDALSPADIGAATASHNHDGVYATAGHDHSGVYAPATHSHNDLYYTETEINALFNTSTGHDHDGTDSKKITWTNIDSKPSTYAPSSHDNTAHSATYITAAGVTYENLSANGDVGTGSSQVAAGNHGHALTSLSDVSVSSPTDGQVLTWDTGTSRWVAETPAGSVDQGEVVKLAWFWN